MESLAKAFAEVAPEGRVDRDGFARVLGRLGFADVPVDRMWEVFDEDHSGFVDTREFLCGMTVLDRGGEDALRLCFNFFDANGDGSITREELVRVLLLISGRESASDAAGAPHGPSSKATSVGAASDRDDGAPSAPASATGSASATPGARRAMLRQRSMRRNSYADDQAAADVDIAQSEAFARLFDTLDVNHDGTISLEEFLDGVKDHPMLVQAFLGPLSRASEATGLRAGERGDGGVGEGAGGGGAEGGIDGGGERGAGPGGLRVDAAAPVVAAATTSGEAETPTFTAGPAVRSHVDAGADATVRAVAATETGSAGSD